MQSRACSANNKHNWIYNPPPLSYLVLAPDTTTISGAVANAREDAIITGNPHPQIYQVGIKRYIRGSGCDGNGCVNIHLPSNLGDNGLLRLELFSVSHVVVLLHFSVVLTIM